MAVVDANAMWTTRCEGREFVGHFDDCFNDLIPGLEILGLILKIVMIYPFSWYSLQMFVPAEAERKGIWASKKLSNADTYRPIGMIVACFALAWVIVRLATFPWSPYHMMWSYLYWTGAALWWLIAASVLWVTAQSQAGEPLE